MADREFYNTAFQTYTLSAVNYERVAVDVYDADTGDYLRTIWEATFPSTDGDIDEIGDIVQTPDGDLFFVGGTDIDPPTTTRRGHVVAQDGTELQSWNFTATGIANSPITALAVDQDGICYVGYLNNSADQIVMAFQQDGTPVDSWTISSPATAGFAFVVVDDILSWVDTEADEIHQYDLDADSALPDLVSTSGLDPFTDIRWDGTVFSVNGVNQNEDSCLRTYSDLGVLVTAYTNVTTAGLVQLFGTNYWFGPSAGEMTIFQMCTDIPDLLLGTFTITEIPNLPGGATPISVQAFQWLMIGSDVEAECVGPTPPSTTRYSRALRRFPLPFSQNKEVFIGYIEFFIQSGVGLLPVQQGDDPQLMVRFSKDGGKTFGPEIWVSMGEMGQYGRRAYINGLGRGRNWVCEVTVSDPVFIGFITCFVNVEEGLA